MTQPTFKAASGATGVKLTDLLDSVGCINEDRVEWKREDGSYETRINGHNLRARQVRMDFAVGYIDGVEAVDRADTVAEIMGALLSKVAI